MARISVKKKRSGITQALEQMIKRANMTEGYLNRVVYREYQKAQRQRWRTENSGPEFGGKQPWERLDPEYEEKKYAKFMDNPFGRGDKMLIATGRLFFSVVGPDPEHRKIVSGKRLEIGTTVPYAKYVDEERTFTEWSPLFYSRILKGLRDYLAKGILKEIR